MVPSTWPELSVEQVVSSGCEGRWETTGQLLEGCRGTARAADSVCAIHRHELRPVSPTIQVHASPYPWNNMCPSIKFRFKRRFRNVFKIFNIFSSKHCFQVTHIIFKGYASKCCHYIWEGHIKLVFSTEYPSNIIINVQHTLWSLNDPLSSVT